MSNIILTDKTLKSESQDKNEEKENEKLKEENENENENVNENDDDETMSQKDKKIIKRLNDFDQIIDKSKSFEEQIKLLKKLENLNEHYDMHDYDIKELKIKNFKLQIARLSNIINEKLYERIFGHTLVKLADKLVNTTNKEENQIIVNSIHKNIDVMEWMIYMTLLILL